MSGRGRQADCGGNPGMMRALGKRAMNRRCVGIGMDCSYCPPSAAVWTQKGRIYITYRRTDRTTKDSLAQQVWVRERRESTTEPIFRAFCAAYIIDIPILLSIAFGCIGEMCGSSEAIFVGQFTRTIRLRERARVSDGRHCREDGSYSPDKEHLMPGFL